MDIEIDNNYVEVHFDRDKLIRELIKEIKRCCKCNFDRDKKLYDELVELIQKRQQEPIDLSCIE